MEKKILVPVADGIEMIEALGIVDVFRRAGARVDMASVNDLIITSSHNVKIYADKLIDDCVEEDYDLVAVPGGIPGAENLKNSETLIKILKKQNEEDKIYGAICASPALVLEHHGLLEGKRLPVILSLQQISGTRTIRSRKWFLIKTASPVEVPEQ